MNKKLIGTLSTALVFGTVFAASFGVGFALQIKDADDVSFSIGAESKDTNFYVLVYRGTEVQSKTKMTLNTSGDNANKEMYATGIEMEIGDKAIIYSESGDNMYQGSPWQHDISSYTAVKTNDENNYVANFSGSYSFYSKFSKTDFTIDDYSSTWVVAPENLTFYFVKPNSWSDWTGDFYYYLFGGSGEKTAWRGDKFTKVKDNYVYDGGNKGTLYSLTLAKSDILARNKYIVNCTGGKQTVDIYYSWFSSYAFNGIYLNYDNGDKVNIFTYQP
ncbi:MAG: hypothetical protein MJ222_04670 [Bacilli bacterium]|nr:hypothetical protein [Bacilli bacterium]